MAKKHRGLGRGLDALLGSSPVVSNKEDSSTFDSSEATNLKDLPVDVIQRGKYQPRVDMNQEALEDLANSIKAQGIVQPIVVRPISDTMYEIIAGERRWRATQLAGIDTIPAIIRDVPDEAAVAMALIENIQREELTPIEEAAALQRLIEEFDMTHMQAAEAVGRSRVAVTNLLRLLSLSDEVKRMLGNGDLEMGHARALLALEGTEQIKAAHQVSTKGMSVRETEKLVKRIINGFETTEHRSPIENPDVVNLQGKLSETLGAKVKIMHKNSGKGKLEIQYNSLDELDGILAHIK
ncbi:MAG: ParB/RepB/Spo0J family partition protein [Gammaproteobacteria bacterium]|nr:ParB/RepB/Spo0J family partition protein [Gammaproteobacteria bacterium]